LQNYFKFFSPNALKERRAYEVTHPYNKSAGWTALGAVSASQKQKTGGSRTPVELEILTNLRLRIRRVCAKLHKADQVYFGGA